MAPPPGITSVALWSRLKKTRRKRRASSRNEMAGGSFCSSRRADLSRASAFQSGKQFGHELAVIGGNDTPPGWPHPACFQNIADHSLDVLDLLVDVAERLARAFSGVVPGRSSVSVARLMTVKGLFKSCRDRTGEIADDRQALGLNDFTQVEAG